MIDRRWERLRDFAASCSPEDLAAAEFEFSCLTDEASVAVRELLRAVRVIMEAEDDDDYYDDE